MSRRDGVSRRAVGRGLIGGLAFLAGMRPALAAVPKPDLPGAWELAFADEFDGDALDRSVWSTELPFGRTLSGNGELEWYVDEAVGTGDGMLRLVADRRHAKGRNSDTGAAQDFDYVSGVVTTFGKFSQRYGYFEMQARLPQGRGLWPAFWLLPADKSWPPEIDVFEYPKPGEEIFVSNHSAEDTDIEGVRPWFDPTRGFHHYALDWRPDELVFYIDRRPVHHIRRFVPDRPMCVIANLAVGGKWPGAPTADTRFPAVFEIDYIRVWRRTG